MEEVAISEQIERLYGDVDWRRDRGVLHVAAIAEQPRCAIAIGPAAPGSPLDRFVLGFARARADVILTTGAILRAEPGLVHCYSEQRAEEAAFARWREQVLGRRARPALLLFSASGRFPKDHPALTAAEAGMIWTTPAGEASLDASAIGSLSVESSGNDGESLAESVAGAISRARSLLGAETILVEAGPTTASVLYGPAEGDPEADPGADPKGSRVGVDELLLSRFDAALDARAVGPDFVSEARIGRRFGSPRSSVRIEESSGPWHFQRFRR